MIMLQTTALQTDHRASVRQIPARPGRNWLAKLDGRTREARFIATLRADLVRHVGGSPSITEAELIDMAVDIAFEIEAMKRRRAERDATLSLHDHRTFLAYQNTFRRTLAQLGMKAAERPALSLAERLLAQPGAHTAPASVAPATPRVTAPATPPSGAQQAAA